MSAAPFMTVSEGAFFASLLRADDVVFEWGSGTSTLWLSGRVAHVVTVDHQPEWVAWLMAFPVPRNVTAILAQPTKPFLEGGDDGDAETFARYVGAYGLVTPDVVLLDGRARVACAERVARGPHAPRVVLLHDCDRSEYAPVMGDWEVAERVDHLALLRRRR